MKNVKVVKLDGQAYLCELGKGTLTGIQLDGGMERVAKGDVARYFRVANVDEFLTLTFNDKTSAVMSRELDEDEQMMFTTCQFVMDTAKKKALSQLENQTFTGLLKN